MIPAEGELASDFTLPDQDGNPVRLQDFRGRTVILYFYPRDNTPGCTKEACSLRDGWADITARDTVVLGVSPDSPESHRKFRAAQSLPFTLLSDPDHRVMEQWGAWGEKTLYGKKSIGVIRCTWVIGPDGRIVKSLRKVDTAAHADQLKPWLPPVLS